MSNPNISWEGFKSLRAGFHFWAVGELANMLRVPPSIQVGHFIELHKESLPAEFVKWYELSDKEFAAFLVGKLGKLEAMLADPAAHATLMQKMVEGVADTDPVFTGFLIWIAQHCAGLFFEYLHTMLVLAKQLQN